MAELILATDTLNQGRIKINESINQSEQALNNSSEAINKSSLALLKSNEALSNSQDTQNQLDAIVIDGDSSVEAAQARVNSDGKTFTTLKNRLDYEDIRKGQYIVGIEYMRHFHDKIRTQQNSTGVFGGDSTMYGTSILDEKYKIPNLSKAFLNNCGYVRFTAINAGHEGKQTSDWLSTYLDLDMSQNPDVYFWHYGLNDGARPIETRLEDFTNDLIEGLTNMRAVKTVDQMSVVLMMPNSANDDTYNRNAEWLEAIYPVIKQAARDFQCCFVDTYHYLLDSTNVTWQDTPMGDGTTHIHPLETGNAWIVSLLSEVLVPESIRNHGVTNITSDTTVSNDTVPSAFNLGVTTGRAIYGFPVNGMFVVIRTADNVAMQINTSLFLADQKRIAFRLGNINSGISGSIGDDAWGQWTIFDGGTDWQSITLQNGWVFNGGATDSLPRYKRDSANNVICEGFIKDGTATLGTVIFNLPVGLRPLKEKIIKVGCYGSLGFLKVLPNGNVTCLSVPYNQWLSLDGFSFQAEQ